METGFQLDRKVKKIHIKALLLYLLLFYLVWSLKELWLINYIHSFGEITSAYLNALVKIFIWIVPVWLYVKYYLNTKPMEYLNLNVNVMKGILWGLVLSLLVGFRYVFEVYILNHQTFNFVLPLNSYLNAFLLAGITEEIVFRGLLLQEISKKLSFWKANVITSLLFLVIHYPIWIYKNDFFDLWTHFYVFFLGLIFGFIYKKTGSLWSVIILHSFHNFFVMII